MGAKNFVIGLTYDLRDDYLKQGFKEEEVAEFDTVATIDALDNTIKSLGYATERIGNAKALCKALVAGKRWDLVFNIAEGVKGRSREAQVPAILELYDIPYTFSDALTLAVSLDKAVTKQIVRDAGLNTPDFLLVTTKSDLDKFNLQFPVFVKPLAEGTGKGIDGRSKVSSKDELVKTCTRLLKEYNEPVIVEAYLPGREFTVGVWGNSNKAQVIGTTEVVILPHAPIKTYSYEMKEECEKFIEYVKPAKSDLISKVEDLALASYKVLQCRDAGRVDIKVDDKGKPSFMEINPLAGLNPTHSDLPIIATQNGIPYDKLIKAIIDGAISRTKK
jgi:D-alanine-D-alanine ligase